MIFTQQYDDHAINMDRSTVENMQFRPSDSCMNIDPEVFDEPEEIYADDEARLSVAMLSGLRFSGQSDFRNSDFRPSELSIRFSGLSDMNIDISKDDAMTQVDYSDPQSVEFPPCYISEISMQPNEIYSTHVDTRTSVVNREASFGFNFIQLQESKHNQKFQVIESDKKQNRLKAISTWLMKREKRALGMTEEPVRNARKEAAARRIRVNGRFLKPGMESCVQLSSMTSSNTNYQCEGDSNDDY